LRRARVRHLGTHAQQYPPQGQPYSQPQTSGAPQSYPQPQAQQYPPQGQPYSQPQTSGALQSYPQPQAQQYPPQGQPYPQPQTSGAPQSYPQPQAQQYPPQGQPYPQPQTSGAPQSYPQPQAQPYPPQGQPYPQAQVSGAPQAYPQPQAQQYPPQGQPYPQAAPQMAPNPYAASNRPNARATTRGSSEAPIKIVHDHFRAGDRAWFENECGALLSVDGGELIFTPGSSADTALAIPAGDIYEIRLNTTAAKELGAFHIATRKGVWLNLAPESGSRDDSRAAIDSLKKLLGIAD